MRQDVKDSLDQLRTRIVALESKALLTSLSINKAEASARRDNSRNYDEITRAVTTCMCDVRNILDALMDYLGFEYYKPEYREYGIRKKEKK